MFTSLKKKRSNYQKDLKYFKIARLLKALL